MTTVSSISLQDLSLTRSNLGLFLGTSALSLVAVLALPYAATAAGIALVPWALSACKAAVAAAIVLAAIVARRRLYYDISLIYTICTQRVWWHEISKDVVLGAIPLEHHVAELKALGVTHVIALLEDFELQRGIVNPATSAMWKTAEIAYHHASAKDFEGVPATTIRDVIGYMNSIRSRHPQAKFYVHCKAGRGRSATIVVADRVGLLFQNQRREELIELIDSEIAKVKAIRNRVNLNPGQRATILAYCELKQSSKLQLL